MKQDEIELIEAKIEAAVEKGLSKFFSDNCRGHLERMARLEAKFNGGMNIKYTYVIIGVTVIILSAGAVARGEVIPFVEAVTKWFLRMIGSG